MVFYMVCFIHLEVIKWAQPCCVCESDCVVKLPLEITRWTRQMFLPDLQGNTRGFGFGLSSHLRNKALQKFVHVKHKLVE